MFKKIKSMSVTKESRAQYLLDAVPGSPVLTVKHAGESNKGWYNAVGKQAFVKARGAGGKKLRWDPTFMAEQRELERGLYAKHVIVGWSPNPIDDEGNDVPFSPDVCQDLMDALPDDMFDDLRAFCQDPDNFRDFPGGEELGES